MKYVIDLYERNPRNGEFESIRLGDADTMIDAYFECYRLLGIDTDFRLEKLKSKTESTVVDGETYPVYSFDFTTINPKTKKKRFYFLLATPKLDSTTKRLPPFSDTEFIQL